MSRRYCKTEYLNLNEGKRIEAESLEEAIKQHPEVKTVVLFWTWEREYYTSNASKFSAYVHEHTIDEEYCFNGGRKDALKFAQSYDCWDGQDFLILKGDLLYGYNAEYDMQTSWNDGYDHISGIGAGLDPSWLTWLRVDFDYDTGTEYLLSPDPFPKQEVRV